MCSFFIELVENNMPRECVKGKYEYNHLINLPYLVKELEGTPFVPP